MAPRKYKIKGDPTILMEKWLLNLSINPETGKDITIMGSTFKTLQKKYGNPYEYRNNIIIKFIQTAPYIVQEMILHFLAINVRNKKIREEVRKVTLKALVRNAAKGNLSKLEVTLKECNFLPDIMNYSDRWEEVEDKFGIYEKSWTWNSDTPLIAASRNNQFEVVKYLLKSGADPTLKSCIVCDKYETALTAAKDPKVKQLIETALKFWESSANSHAGAERWTEFKGKPNYPKDLGKLREAIDSI